MWEPEWAYEAAYWQGWRHDDWHDEAENYWQDDWQWDQPEAPSEPKEIEPNPDA